MQCNHSVKYICNRTIDDGLGFTKRFRYPALESAHTHFRLLKVVCMLPNIRPSFTLETFHLWEAPEYKFLSYVWGDTRSKFEVEIDGTIFWVRENLHDYFRHANLQSGSYIWIDAICINQNDPVERGIQVQQMSRIFCRADCTISWLGFKDDGIANLFALVANNRLVTLELTMKNAWLDRALSNFCQLKYWTRLWIVPEMLLSQNLFLQYRQEYLDWSKISFFLRSVRSLRYQELVTEPQTYREGDIHIRPETADLVLNFVAKWDESRSAHRAIRYERYSSVDSYDTPWWQFRGLPCPNYGFSEKTLAAVIDKYRSHGCKDARDKIYALKNLFDDYEDFTVDYEESNVELLLRVLRQESNHHRLTLEQLKCLYETLGIQLPSIDFHKPRGLAIFHHQNRPSIRQDLLSWSCYITKEMPFTIQRNLADPGRNLPWCRISVRLHDIRDCRACDITQMAYRYAFMPNGKSQRIARYPRAVRLIGLGCCAVLQQPLSGEGDQWELIDFRRHRDQGFGRTLESELPVGATDQEPEGVLLELPFWIQEHDLSSPLALQLLDDFVQFCILLREALSKPDEDHTLPSFIDMMAKLDKTERLGVVNYTKCKIRDILELCLRS